MQQISPPLRIALAAIVVLGALWFTVLRPKPDTSAEAPLPQAPGVAGLATATQKAQGAVATANKAAATEQATGADAAKASVSVTKTPTATKVTKSTTAKKGSKEATVSKTATVKKAPPNPAAPLLTALNDGKVVVLLFRNTSPDSADVSTLVRTIGKRKKVVSHLAWIRDVGEYQTFTADTPIQQAPTVMVIGPRKNVKLIVGFTSAGELAQAVADVRRAGSKSS